MIKLPSIDRSNSEDVWTAGADVYIDPASVIVIEPKQHRYHSFRPAQNYAVIYLTTGAAIEVMRSAETVSAVVEEGLTKGKTSASGWGGQ